MMNYNFNKKEFDEEFEENRKLYKEKPDEAHKKQIENVKKLDDYTGGKSRYDEESGIWYLSDGRQSDKMNNGTIGNSFLDDTFNRENSAWYKEYEDNRRKYSESEFSYDKEKDPVYKSYKKQYKENGEKVMDDTLAKASAKTGGIASSYAVSAASAAANDYIKGLDDIALKLEDKEYEKFKEKLGRYLENMSIAEGEMAKEEADWQRNNSLIKENKEEEKAKDEAEKEKNEKNKEDYSFVLSKFQDSGWENLSDEDKKIALNNGWYDVNTGYLYDSAGNAYAPKYSNVERALAKYKAKGLEKLSEDELLSLTHAGYKVRYGMLLDERGYAV